MKFTGLIDYASRRGLRFEQIALRRIVLVSGGEWPYRETHVLTDGGWWVHDAILRYNWQAPDSGA